MAVNVISQPGSHEPAGDCVEFELELTDGGSGDTIKSLGYQLFADGGGELTQEEQIPFTGAPEKINFSRDLLPQVTTPFPGIETQISGAEVPEMKAGYYLKYGEILFDRPTCQVTKNITSQTATKYVFGAATPFFRPDSFWSQDIILLTSRVRGVNYIRPDQNDWIYIYARTTIYVYVSWVFRDGSTGNTEISVNGSDTIHAVSVGTANAFFLSDLSNVEYYTVTFSFVPGGLFAQAGYVFRVESDCTDEAPINELFWLEPLGGFASLKFDTVEIGNSTTAVNYATPTPCNATLSQRATMYGNSRYETNSRKTIQLKREIPYKTGLDEFLDGLFASGTHLVKWPVPGLVTPVVIPVKVVLGGDSGYRFNSANNSIELQVFGEVHLPVNAL